MDDNLSEVQAIDAPVADEQQSEALTEDENPTDEAETETDADEEGADEEGSAEPEKPKKRSGIERLKRQLAQERAEKEMLRSQAARVLDSGNIEAALEREIGKPPKEEDYPSWYEYERALTAYETDKRFVSRDLRRRAEEAQAHQSARAQAALEDHLERESEVATAIPDYRQTMEAVRTLDVSDTVARVIIESDKGPLLKYHLAKNVNELKALNAMDPVSAALALGRLEQRLSLPTANKTTKAQPPVSSLKGGAGPVSDEAKLDAYIKRKYGG